jgi:hypothetical protein
VVGQLPFGHIHRQQQQQQHCLAKLILKKSLKSHDEVKKLPIPVVGQLPFGHIHRQQQQQQHCLAKLILKKSLKSHDEVKKIASTCGWATPIWPYPPPTAAATALFG